MLNWSRSLRWRPSTRVKPNPADDERALLHGSNPLDEWGWRGPRFWGFACRRIRTCHGDAVERSTPTYKYEVRCVANCAGLQSGPRSTWRCDGVGVLVTRLRGLDAAAGVAGGAGSGATRISPSVTRPDPAGSALPNSALRQAEGFLHALFEDVDGASTCSAPDGIRRSRRAQSAFEAPSAGACAGHC